MMSVIYGHEEADFLALEPDEVAAAILPEVLAGDPTQLVVWNILNSARQNYGEAVANAVGEGVNWLFTEGYITPSPVHMDRHRISRRGTNANLSTDIADARAMGLLRSAALDASLAQVVLPIFRRGQYDIAVFAALREVEDRVRHASGTTGEVGTKLMRASFGRGGRLADPSLDHGEVAARADLFAGAMGVHRNATGHQLVDYADPQEAAEVVLLANNLLRHLDRAIAATRGPGRPPTRRARKP